MKKKDNRRYDQIKKQTSDGVFGKEAQNLLNDFQNVPKGSVEVFFKPINNFFSKDINPIFKPYAISLIKIILSLFLKNNKNNPELSDYFTLTFNRDIDDLPNSCIKDKFANMLEAGHAFKQSVRTNKLVLWELSKNYFLSYNEFMNHLIGIILINLQYLMKNKYKLNTLNNAYGNKINELKNLKPKADYYDILLELLNPDIRNAIAHQTIWFNEKNNNVIYETKKGIEEKIGIKEFILLNSKASYLAEAYLVALSTIGVYYFGSMMDRTRFPKELFLIIMEINK